MRSRDEIKSLLQKVLSSVKAPKAQVEYFYRGGMATRFGDNAITQNMDGAQETLRAVVAYDNHHGSSMTNRFNADSISTLVRRAEDIAKVSPGDPEYMPPVGAQVYPEVPQRYYEDVAKVTPARVAEEVYTVVEEAKAVGYRASGLFEVSRIIEAVANSEGLFCIDRVSNLDYSTTMHGPFGSGWTRQNGESLMQVNAESMAQQALWVARAAQNPRSIEPGEYTVILEPQAVYDFLMFFLWNMSARDADEGTTAFAGKVGQRIFSEKLIITTRIDDPELPAPPFGQDGLASRNTVWVKRGILQRLRHDRYWASQKGTDPDPLVYPIFMMGQDQTLTDLIAQCERGLLIKTLWYIRYVDRKQLLLTGMTRNGLFLIQDGRVAYPVHNLRFNESPIVFLQNIVAMSRPERVGAWVKVPGIMSEGFTFTSKTESV